MRAGSMETVAKSLAKALGLAGVAIGLASVPAVSSAQDSTMLVRAKAIRNCRVLAQPTKFGTIPFFFPHATGQASFFVECTRDTANTAAIDDAYRGGSRHLSQLRELSGLGADPAQGSNSGSS